MEVTGIVELKNVLNPAYYDLTRAGRGFVYSTSTAVSVVALGTAGAPTLWNPAGSGRLCVLTKVTWQAAAIGTPVISGFQYGFTKDVGAQAGTGSPVASATYVDGVNLLLGGESRDSKMKFIPATNTLGAAPTFLCAAGLNLGATATQTPWTAADYIDGRIIIAPDTLFQIGASTATSTTFNISIFGLEIPYDGVD